MSDALPTNMKVCIVGAGCSGFTTAKRLKDFGIAYEQFEMSDNIGGNWYHKNPNGKSACYQSLHIDTSKFRLAFEDYPVPDDWPDFPITASFLIISMIMSTISACATISLSTRRWTMRAVMMTVSGTSPYRAVRRANMARWWSQTVIIGTPKRRANMATTLMASKCTAMIMTRRLSRMICAAKMCWLSGVGNSAMDIASEVSQRPIAKKCFISARRGVWVLPKYLNGEPADKSVMPAWMPQAIGRKLGQMVIKKAVGNMEDYGLPKPDHEVLTAHPSVSGEFLTRLGCGDVTVKGGLESLDGDGVRFADGSREEIDVIIWATGYRISFPFLQQNSLAVEDNKFPLYRRMVKPGWRNLFFVGLAQPLPTLVNLAEQQSKFIANVLAGNYAMPDDTAMEKTIIADEKVYLGHYYDSERHTIQIDFNKYVSDLKKELRGNWIAAE